MNLIDDLQKIKNEKIFIKDIKKKIKNYYLLLSKKMIKKIKREEETESVPDDVPQWASKFKFTKKKYGVKSDVSIEEFVVLTDKGDRELKRLKRKSKKEKLEDKDVDNKEK
jgi:hypothetical protein